MLLTREAFAEAKLLTNLSVVTDGKEAIDFLARQGKYVGETLPDLLLLDINLPKINGHEVLQYVKQQQELMHIPVVMLSTSSSPKDVTLAADNNAKNFLTKPLDVSELMAVIASIKTFGITIVKMPANEDGG